MSTNEDWQTAVGRWTGAQRELWHAWSDLLREGARAVAPRSGDGTADAGDAAAEAPDALTAGMSDGANALHALARLSLETWRAAFAVPGAGEDWPERMHDHARRWMDQTFGAALGTLQGEIDADEQWRRWVAQLQGLGLPFLGALEPSQRAFGGALDALGSSWQDTLRDGWDVMPRVLDGLAQAPSLGTAKPELQRKILEGFNAWSASQVLNHEYQALRAKAWVEVVHRAARELAERAHRDEPVQTLREWMMLWIGAGDDVLMDLYRSQEYLRVQRELMAQTLTARVRLQEARDLVLAAYNLPTRGELDDAYRVIHELRREVRALKRTVASLDHADADGRQRAPAKGAARASKARRARRKPAARGRGDAAKRADEAPKN